jgi:hypothetical protein
MSTRLALLLALCSASAVSARDLPADLRSRATPMPGSGAETLDAALDDGRALLAAANPVQAIAAFRTALALDGSSLAALNGLGVAYDRLGRTDLACQHFQMALAIAPDAADIAYNLGWSLARAGQDRAAIAPLQRAAAGSDARVTAAARRALALIAARLEAPPPAAPAPLRVANARIDMVASGEAVLVLAEPPRPAAAPQPAPPSATPAHLRMATTAPPLQAELAARLGDAADLTRPAQPVAVAAAEPVQTPAPPPAARPVPAPVPAPAKPADEAPADPATPAAPLPALAVRAVRAELPALVRQLPLLAPGQRRVAAAAPPVPPIHPALPPEPADPAADIRMAIARLERLITLIEQRHA